MKLKEEVKQKYLDFCNYGTGRRNVHVYLEENGNVCVQDFFEYGNSMGTNEYNIFSIGKQEDNNVLRQIVSKTEFKWEYDENGGESPNNGEWEIEREIIEYKIPENFDLYNPDFSQVEKLGKNKRRK